MRGRPGLNPLHLDVTYEVTQEQIETIRAIAEQSGLERERGQNELVNKLPADFYDRFRVSQDATPGEAYRIRYGSDTKGFPADRGYWETVVPICSYAEGRLEAITANPVTLGFGQNPHQRGRPRLASGTDADAILDRFAALSRPFGTEITRDGDSVRVSLRERSAAEGAAIPA